MNLDKLLRKIEKNKETENEIITHQLVVGGETYEVKTLTRSQKSEFVYAQEANNKNTTAGDIVKRMKKFIYLSMDLKDLAVKAKDAGYIKSYYDVIEALFEPEEILEIVAFIIEINKIGQTNATDGIDELKKQ